ncbi:hypothetical protein Bca52824_021669 [Brassica carinata]|uniref:Uncharacterized protein n=1 Tax=Brassica carinata TaxID=52824 RepID=A0A8X7VEY7_BRACI|nr:hypothetical protein Bca52824_021669 [Brassica carinata]
MGQDYSYNQPSSSSESVDITSLLEAEAQIYADEADSSYCNAMPVQYPHQPEADDGIPTTCYCGAQPVLGCSYTPKDPYRRVRRRHVNQVTGAFGGVKVTGSSTKSRVLQFLFLSYK